MAPTVDYAYYRDGYGGSLDEASFLEALPMALDHVRWFCHGTAPEGDGVGPWKRAVCACCDAFAAEGDGAGFAVGDFAWRPTALSQRGGTGRERANQACLEILGLTTMAFAGVR